MRNKLGFILILLCLATSAMAKVYDYTEGNKLTLIEDPALGVDHKVELIRSAKHHIHILTFFWDKSKVPARLAKELHDANARGVEVRILTTFIPTLSTDLLGRGKRKLKAGSDAVFAYQALTPGINFSFTNSLHEKIFLVDGEKAIIGGRNISDSSLNGKDMEVEMQGPVVNQVQEHYKKMFDFVIALKKRDCDQEKAPNCEADYDRLTFDNSSKYFPVQPQYEDGAPTRILSHEAVIHQYETGIKRSERLEQPDDILDTVTKIEFKKLRAYNYFMLPTKRYRDFLDKNLAEGNSIEMITNSQESAKFSSNWGYIYSIPDALELVNQGLELYQWQRKQKLNYVHEKVLIFDEDHVIIGSHNFGTGSTGVSNEISIEIKSKAIADRLITVFDSEKTNPAITHKADSALLEREYESHKSMISILRKKLLSSILLEIY